jgi:nitroreductase
MVQKIDNFWMVLERRHCVRSFNPDKKISKQDLTKILEAGHKNPTAGGLHPEKFMVIKDSSTKERLAEASYGQNFIVDAPVVIVVCADLDVSSTKYGQRGRELYSVQDTAAATQNMFLAATALGIGACWVGGFEEKKGAEILKLPNHIRPLVIFPLGYEK